MEGTKVGYQGAFEPKAIIDFLDLHAAPPVLEYAAHVNFIHYGPVHTHVILFASKASVTRRCVPALTEPPQSDPQYASVLSTFKAAAVKHRGQYLFIEMDAAKHEPCVRWTANASR